MRDEGLRPALVCSANVLAHVPDIRDFVAGVAVLLCGVRPDLMKVINTSGLVKRIGAEHVFVFQETGEIWSATLEALRVAYEMIGDDVCEHCPRHAQRLNDRKNWVYEI